MLYYEITANNKDNKWQDEKSEDYKTLATETEKYNSQEVSDNYYLLSRITPETIKACAIVERLTDVKAGVEKFFKYLNLSWSDIKFREVNTRTINSMIRQSAKIDLCEDHYELCDEYNINGEFHYWKKEILIEAASREKVELVGKSNRAPKSYMEELERIYQHPNIERRSIHPVHYVFGSDNEQMTKKLVENLLDALIQNHRIFSKRTLWITDIDRRNIDFQDEYESCKGGAIVFCIDEEVDAGSNASSYHHFLDTNGSIIKKYRNDVLTIVVFPRECKRLKELLYDELSTMTFVEMMDELIDGKEAREVLEEMSKENNIHADAKLTATIDDSSKYYMNEILTIFDEWYSAVAKTKIFPQYCDCAAPHNKGPKVKAKGNSYEELESMIGLSEAKKVINGAINYNKVQKLYKDKGMIQERPSMHMCFTGNPGTAKTTVARLFADIMKQNGILSSGHLVEVGRSDLVGQYVGWTAPNIQAKFKKAKGGVLFIDEAYSLVEDRSGGFGDEAINTIVQEMENHRDELVVIFAGYPDEMKKFLEKNPGLKSRIAFQVQFDDYSTEELVDITRLMADKNHMELTDEALAKLEEIYSVARENADFGNGRFVRNMLEKARLAQGNRLALMDYDAVGKKELKTIVQEDIESWVPEKKKKKTIGFVA